MSDYIMKKTDKPITFEHKGKSYYNINPTYSKNKKYFYFISAGNFLICDNKNVLFSTVGVVSPVYSKLVSNFGDYTYVKDDNTVNELYVKNKYNILSYNLKLEANLYCCNISDEGDYLGLETCYSENDEFSNYIYIVDISKKAILCKIKSDIYHITLFEFFDDYFSVTDENENSKSYLYTGQEK